MPIPEQVKKKFLKFAKHEAGHWVVSNSLGFTTKEISFNIIDTDGRHYGHSVICLDFPSLNVDDIINYCDKRLQVLYAGAFAQSLIGNTVDNDSLGLAYTSNASSDMSKARELVRIVRSFKYPSAKTDKEIQDSLDMVEEDIVNKVGALVIANCKLIEEIGIEIIKGIYKLDTPFILSEAAIRLIVSKY